MFNIFSSGFPTGHANHEKIRCTRCLTKGLSHSAVLSKVSTVVGVPTLVREYSECYQNSQRFAVTGISSTCYVRIQNFRLRTLGVPVRNGDSREASRNSPTPRSSKFEL